MLSDILWISIMSIFGVLGIRRPYIALCGVVWIDTLRPQTLSYKLLVGKPISLIAASIFLISFVLNTKEVTIPKKKFSIFLLILFMTWFTITTYHAQFQANAWFKHDASFKTILITLFFPFVLNSRVKIETFMTIIIASVSYYLIIGGARSLLGEGRYGIALVTTHSSNSGLAETSTLAMVSVMMIPLIYYIYKYSKLVENNKFLKPMLLGLMILSVTTCIGTYARTGLIGLFLYLLLIIRDSKKKIKYMVYALVAIIVILIFTPQDWKDRMGTISNARDESSALGRIVVWRWTLDFVKEHPIFGGGFDAYLANAGMLNSYIRDGDKNSAEFDRAKAFHNIYFEVLGEHGYVGVLIFLLILINCYLNNRYVYKHEEKSTWLYSMAKFLNYSLIIYCVCGNFIAVAFMTLPYYYMSLSVSIYTLKVKKDEGS